MEVLTWLIWTDNLQIYREMFLGLIKRVRLLICRFFEWQNFYKAVKYITNASKAIHINLKNSRKLNTQLGM